MLSLTVRALVPLFLAATLLGACTDDEGADGLKKEVADLRADVQRLQKENEKLSSQVAGHVRRIDGLSEDLNLVRQIAVDVKAAPTAAEWAAAAAPSGAQSGAPYTAAGTVDEIAIKHFLATDAGRRSIEAAIQSERESRERERTARTLDSLVTGFAKEAGLTDEQTTRMKEIMTRQGEAVRELWANVRNLGPDATRDQREALRTENIAKTQELRKKADEEVKALLSQTQYETYEKEQERLRSAMRGQGGGQGAGAAGAGGNAGRRNGRQTNN